MTSMYQRLIRREVNSEITILIGKRAEDLTQAGEGRCGSYSVLSLYHPRTPRDKRKGEIKKKELMKN